LKPEAPIQGFRGFESHPLPLVAAIRLRASGIAASGIRWRKPASGRGADKRRAEGEKRRALRPACPR